MGNALKHISDKMKEIILYYLNRLLKPLVLSNLVICSNYRDTYVQWYLFASLKSDFQKENVKEISFYFI